MEPVTEKELIEKATAPRVTEVDIFNNIGAEYVFNLASAVEAQGMPVHDALKAMTIAVLVLKNGFVVTGQSAPADTTNFNQDIGNRLAFADAKNKIWPLMGYALKQEVHLNGDGTFKGRMEREARELEDKLNKLVLFTQGIQFSTLSEEEQTRLLKQKDVMGDYLEILMARINALD